MYSKCGLKWDLGKSPFTGQPTACANVAPGRDIILEQNLKTNDWFVRSAPLIRHGETMNTPNLDQAINRVEGRIAQTARYLTMTFKDRPW